MRFMDNSLRELIREEVETFKGLNDLIHVIGRMRVATSGPKSPSVPDILTNIRSIEHIVTVKQIGAIKRPKRGYEHVDVEMKILPAGTDQNELLQEIGAAIKSVTGVLIVRFLTVDGHAASRSDGSAWTF